MLNAVTVEVILNNRSITTFSFSSLNNLNSLFHNKPPAKSIQSFTVTVEKVCPKTWALLQLTVFSLHHEMQTVIDHSFHDSRKRFSFPTHPQEPGKILFLMITLDKLPCYPDTAQLSFLYFTSSES